MTAGSATRLAAPAFLEDVLSKELVPLNAQTDTDFILSGGITIAVRKGEDHLLLKIDRLPDHATFIVNHPNRDLLAKPGADLVRPLFELALNAGQRTRADGAEYEPNRNLLSVIHEAMLLYGLPEVMPGIDQRAVIVAPSPIQHGSLALSRTRSRDQNEAFLDAMRPMLAELPVGGVSFEKFNSKKHAYSEIWSGVDYIFAQDAFAATGAIPAGTSVVELMKIVQDLADRIRKIGFDPEPIITAATA